MLKQLFPSSQLKRSSTHPLATVIEDDASDPDATDTVVVGVISASTTASTTVEREGGRLANSPTADSIEAFKQKKVRRQKGPFSVSS